MLKYKTRARSALERSLSAGVVVLIVCLMSLPLGSLPGKMGPLPRVSWL